MCGGPPPVSVIGVPLDLGAGRRGVDMGPSAMRNAGLVARIRSLGREVADEGNLAAPVVESLAGPGDERARYLTEIAGVLETLAERVRGVRRAGRLPVVLGGDHSIALGDGLGHGGGGRRLGRRTDRTPLDRRAHRCQHPADLAERKPARHAAGRDSGGRDRTP